MVAINLERTRVRRFAADAAMNGHPGHFRLEGNCTDPAVVFLRGLPDKLMDLDGESTWLPEVVGTAYVRCRKCPPCKQHRAVKWVARGSHEMRQASRTWFLTLTYRPAERVRVEALARKAYREQGNGDLDLASAQERFAALVKASSPDVTKMLKRLRHKGPFRYLLVAEAHKDGFPHWHALLHEQGQPLTYDAIREEWRSGFSELKLTDNKPKVAWYVCKYLTKSRDARIRASGRYGRDRQLAPLSEIKSPVSSPQTKQNHEPVNEEVKRKGYKGGNPWIIPISLTSNYQNGVTNRGRAFTSYCSNPSTSVEHSTLGCESQPSGHGLGQSGVERSLRSPKAILRASCAFAGALGSVHWQAHGEPIASEHSASESPSESRSGVCGLLYARPACFEHERYTWANDNGV